MTKKSAETYDNLEAANARIAELNEEVKKLKKKITKYKTDIEDLRCARDNAAEMATAWRNNCRW